LEPSTKASEILNGLKYVRPGNGFEPNFMLTERIDVNGDSGHMMYDFMKRSCPATRTKFNKDVFYEPFHERDIRWNFEKILIEPNTGLPYRRYDTAVSPRNLVRDIQQILVTTKNVAPVYSENRFKSHFGNITETLKA
ncbi:glutathione peroxidase-like protein, partial [Leptotrombidium deliense]